MKPWENTAPQFRVAIKTFAAKHGLQDWEAWFAPYDNDVYKFVLERLRPDDVVLDIGAGDFRLALEASGRVRRVYAIEVHPELVVDFLRELGADLPRNLQVICANALDFPFPEDVTVGVLLMRHCRHFSAYFRKLKAAGARSLFTNARWKMGVEEVDLAAERVDFGSAPPGWYACSCGAVGFKEPPQGSSDVSDEVHEVEDCPQCKFIKESL